MPANTQPIFDYVFSLTGSDVKLELSRVHAFMDALGRPYEAYPVIHIAGTNGKGSTAAMLAGILQAYGYRVGLFTSPHLTIPNERIRIGQELVPDEFILEKVNAWKPRIEALGISFFEVLTALGMAYFKEQEVDIAVIETGLGGRLDATNVVDPVLSIITSISLDHTNILGSSMEEITFEKAGIIKPGKPVILSENSELVTNLISKTSKERGSKLIDSSPEKWMTISSEKELYSKVTLKGSDPENLLTLPLPGHHQIPNFANVLACLSELGHELDPVMIQKGLDLVNWGGRMQVLQKDPLVIYDVAHNPAGLVALLESLKASGLEDCILVAAFNARKDITELLQVLKTWKGPVIYTLFSGHSAVSTDSLRAAGVQDRVYPDPAGAYDAALKLRSGKQGICFFGSHYLAEELYARFDVNHLTQA